MKAIFTATLAIAMMVLLLTPGQLFAQSGTLVVYASGQTLDQVINGDVTNGIQNHSVYQLVSLDTTYLIDATITSQSAISIVGIPNPTTGKLPCIEADVLSDQSIPGIFFTFTGQGTRVKLQNLYLLGLAPNNLNNTSLGQGVQISADSISLTIDNCVFDEMAQYEVGYSSNWNKFYITNSKFRNGIDVASAYYVPELIRSENSAGIWSTDSIVVKYNTLLGVAMGPVVTTGITNYFNFSHNDVVLTSKGPLWSEHLVNAVLDNNIFYDVYATGESKAEYTGGWDEIAPPRIPSIFYFNSLDSSSAALLLGHAITGASDYAAAEAARKVEVKNNDYFWSSGLTNFWTAWDDTSHVDSIVTPVFMNNESMAMFNNSSKWPGFVMSGNQNVDPGFGQTITTTLNPGADTAYGVGLLAWIADVRSGTGTTQSYSYQKTEVGTEANWTPTWPLPETTDLKYSNSSLMNSSSDGMALGDPYWFTNSPTTAIRHTATLPNKFTLYDAYPNPFNPSTNIKYSISQTGLVSLKVYNSLGQLVRTLVNNVYQSKGDYQMNVNMDNLSSGVYFYRLEEGNNALTKKMILLK
jgi:hypothetical protein